MKRFTEEHEWVEVKGNTATIGITAHAAKELGDITFVELPEMDTELAQGDMAATVESVKAAAEVYAPISGTVSAVNNSVVESPEAVNDAPEGSGWLFKLTDINVSELESLMTEEDYEEYLG